MMSNLLGLSLFVNWLLISIIVFQRRDIKFYEEKFTRWNDE